MPGPTELINTTSDFNLPTLKGIQVYPDNPFKFDFIIDEEDTKFSQDKIKQESTKLINYFLASITIPEEDLWVNLSPYEQDKIIPKELGLTNMGKDLLGEDYILKQLLASLTYPQSPLGKRFWKKVYQRAQQLFGTTKIPINTFNKIWIVPDKALIHEDDNRAFIKQANLKVMLEEDYLSFENRQPVTDSGEKIAGDIELSEEDEKGINNFSLSIMREIVLPVIEEEVNNGENFAHLRQIYHSLILATWFKQRLKQSLFNRIYIDKKKIKGIDTSDPQIKEKIYNQYVQAFKKGVYNYIQKDYDPSSGKYISRKYYSGGFDGTAVSSAITTSKLPRDFSLEIITSSPLKMEIELEPFGGSSGGVGIGEGIGGTGRGEGPGVGGGQIKIEELEKENLASSAMEDKNLASTQPFTYSDWQNILSQHGLQKANIEHVKRNVRAVEYFAEQEGLDDIDKEILEAALWLHDISKDNPLEDYIPENEKLASTLRLLVHHLEGADIAGEILAQNGYDEEFVKQVKNIIVKHMGPLQGSIPFGDRSVGFMELTRLVHSENIGKALNESSVARKGKLLEYIAQLKKGFPQPKEEREDKKGEDKLARIARDIDLLDLAADGITKVVHLRQTDSGFFKNGRPETIKESFDSALESAESVRKNLYANSAGQIIEELVKRIGKFKREAEKVFISLEERFPVEAKPSEEIFNRRSEESKKLYDGYVKKNEVRYDGILKIGKFASSAVENQNVLYYRFRS